MTRRAGPSSRPSSTIRPRATPTSPLKAGRPEPSMIRPFLISRSYVMSALLPGWWRSATVRAGISCTRERIRDKRVVDRSRADGSTVRCREVQRVKVVVNARNGAHDFECGPGEKILHAGLRSGVELPYECATGTCGTCKARLVSGRAESEWPDAPGRRYFKSEADVLLCQSVARDDCAAEVGVALKPRQPTVTAPRALGGVVRARRRLTHDVMAVDVDLDGPLDFEAGQFALVTAPGTARDAFFLDELEAFRARYPAQLAVTVALSDEDVAPSLAAGYPALTFARGLVHAVAGERMTGRFADVRAYVAGPPPMVDASLRWLLREARLPPADIRYDKFS